MSKSDSRYAIAAAVMLTLLLAGAPAFAVQAAPERQNGPAPESGATPAGGPGLPAGVDNAASIQAFLSQFLGTHGANLSADQLAQAQQVRAQALQMAQQLTAQMKQLMESNGQNPGALLPLPGLPDEAAAKLRQLLDSNGSGAVMPAIPDAGQISAMAEQFRQFLTASVLGAGPSPEELAARLESLKEKIGNLGWGAPNAAPAQNGAAPAATAPALPLPQWPQ